MILLEDYEMKMQQLERIMNLVEHLVYQIPGVDQRCWLIAGILSEAGDLARFDHPRQIVKLAGNPNSIRKEQQLLA